MAIDKVKVGVGLVAVIFGFISLTIFAHDYGYSNGSSRVIRPSFTYDEAKIKETGQRVYTEDSLKATYDTEISYRNAGILMFTAPFGIAAGVFFVLAGVASLLDGIGKLSQGNDLTVVMFWVALGMNLFVFGLSAQAHANCSPGMGKQFAKDHPPPTSLDDAVAYVKLLDSYYYSAQCSQTCVPATYDEAKLAPPEQTAEKELCGNGSMVNTAVAFAIILALINIGIVIFNSCMPATKGKAANVAPAAAPPA